MVAGRLDKSSLGFDPSVLFLRVLSLWSPLLRGCETGWRKWGGEKFLFW